MPVGRFRFAAAVYGVLVDRDRMLLMRRAGSGYRDGELSLPAGHLDGAEDALTGLLRELREVLTITADRDSCRLAVLLHRAPESPPCERSTPTNLCCYMDGVSRHTVCSSAVSAERDADSYAVVGLR